MVHSARRASTYTLVRNIYRSVVDRECPLIAATSGPSVARARPVATSLSTAEYSSGYSEAELMAWHNGDVPDSTTDSVVKRVWIDPSWLSWERLMEGRFVFSTDAVDRPYVIQQHACDRLVGDPSDLDRADAIIALRRAVDQRVQKLKEIYQIRKLRVTTPEAKGDLHLLSSFDIIRPFMVKRLIEIRNVVEHQDREPPPTAESLMFADLVWYFLRSTDSLVRGRVDQLLFYPPGSDPFAREYNPSVSLFHPGRSGLVTV